MDTGQVSTLVLQTLDLVLRDTNEPMVQILTLIQNVRAPTPQRVINFGNRQVDIHINLYAGRPGLVASIGRGFLEEERHAGGFKWHMYLKTGGTWTKNISGTGIIVHAECYIDGPLCPHCGVKDTINIQETQGFWGAKTSYQCLSCMTNINYKDPGLVLRDLASDTNRLLPKALGFGY
jgi:hypothetical protein